MFYPAIGAAGIDHRTIPRDLRHTAASLMIRSGADPKTAPEQLGHASIQTTFSIYGHLCDEQRVVMAARQPDNLLRREAE